MKVVVGSKNPVKIEAVRLSFEKIWPETMWEVIGVEVNSGVPDQPMSDSESITGARTRAKKALLEIESDYGVGLEGGIQQVDELFFDCGWIVVIDKTGAEGIGASPKMIVPEKMMTLISQGHELGTAADILFNTKNSKQANGTFGMMTNDAVTRTTGYQSGIIMALSRFLHPELF